MGAILHRYATATEAMNIW